MSLVRLFIFVVVFSRVVRVFASAPVLELTSAHTNEFSHLHGLNNSGDLLVTLYGPNQQPAVFRDGKMRALPWSRSFWIGGISDRGAAGEVYACATVFFGEPNGYQLGRAAVWKLAADGSATYVLLPNLTEDDQEVSYAHAVNSSGVVVGVASRRINDTEYRSFATIWAPPYESAIEYSYEGSFIHIGEDGTRLANKYSFGTVTSGTIFFGDRRRIELPKLDGLYPVTGFKMAGEWVVGVVNIGQGQKGVVWRIGDPSPITLPATGDPWFPRSGIVNSVNAEGDAVGPRSSGAMPRQSFAYWDRHNGAHVAHALKDLVHPPMRTMADAVFVNDKGQIAIGYPHQSGRFGYESVVALYSRVNDGFVGFTNSFHEATEGKDKELRVPVKFIRPHENTNEVTVTYETEGPTSAHYTPVSGTLRWSAQESGEKDIVVPLIDNDTFEGNTPFRIRLGTPVRARAQLSETTNVAFLRVIEPPQSIVPSNRIELEGPWVAVLSGEPSVTIELDRPLGVDGAITFTNLEFWEGSALAGEHFMPATNLGAAWGRGEGGTRTIVVPLNPDIGLTNFAGRFVVFGTVLLEGETILGNWTIGVAILPKGTKQPLEFKNWRVNTAFDRLTVRANAPQGAIVELLAADSLDGAWAPISETRVVGPDAAFDIEDLTATAKYFAVRMKP